MEGELDRVVAAVDALATRPVLPAGDATLIRRLEAVHRAIRRLSGVELALVREIDAAGVAARAGAPSTAVWLTLRLMLTPGAARRTVALAAGVDAAPPVVGSALAAGEVGVDQARAIVGALADLPPEVGREVVDKAAVALVGYADHFPPPQLARLGSQILWHVAPAEAEEADRLALARSEERAAHDRYLSFTPDGPSSVRVHGRLGLEAAAVVHAALDPLCNPAARAVTRAATVRGAPADFGDGVSTVPPTGVADVRRTGRAGVVAAALTRGAGGDREADDRTAGQRRADALVEVCRMVLAGGRLPDNGGDRPQVVVTVPFDPLRRAFGTGVIDTGDRLSADAARRLACDARILPAVLDGAGQPLDLGRERRLFTGPLRRALVLRDGGCAFPGCDRPPRWCDGHHVIHWADGGPTSLANAVLLCGHHHRLIHDARAGWTVHIGAGGRPAFVPPGWVDPRRIPRRNAFHRRQ